MPLTTLFAPATLSIGSAEVYDYKSTEVLNAGISNSSLVDAYLLSPETDEIAPSFQRLIDSVALSGQIASPKAPGAIKLQANSSYLLQTYLPLMRCSEGNDTIRDQLYAWLMGNYTRPYIA
jgi:hypothetical protein